jgi:hypothetical protein
LDLKYGAVGRKAAMQATSCHEKVLVTGISTAVAVAGIIISTDSPAAMLYAAWFFLKRNRPPAPRG